MKNTTENFMIFSGIFVFIHYFFRTISPV